MNRNDQENRGQQQNQQQKNPGNFKNDRERASEAGRKGGQESHRGSQTPQNR